MGMKKVMFNYISRRYMEVDVLFAAGSLRTFLREQPKLFCGNHHVWKGFYFNWLCLGYNPPGNISTGRTTPESTQSSWSPAPCSPLSPGSTPGTNLCPAQLTLQRSTSLLMSKLFDNDKCFFKGDIFCQFSGVEPVFCVSTRKCLSTF